MWDFINSKGNIIIVSLIQLFQISCLQMNWTQPRKSLKYSEPAFSGTKKIQTTCLNTPVFDKDYKSCKHEAASFNLPFNKLRSCPYHFNNQQHVCLTCRKSICLRCAITYCQNHTIKQEKDIIPVLVQDLQKIYIKQKVSEIETKLGQSLQRQDYFQNKVLKLIQKIEENFNTVIENLKEKKLQIITFYDQEFQKYLAQYQDYDEILKSKLQRINQVQRECASWKHKSFDSEQKLKIQRIDQIMNEVKEEKPIINAQKNLANIFLSKNKVSVDKQWSQQKLEKVLFEIQNIDFKLHKQISIPQMKIVEKKRRIVTQSADNNNKMNNSTHKSPVQRPSKGTGRVIYNKFNSGRKNREEILEKSQLL